MNKDESKVQRRYYEVFGDTLNQVFFFRTLVIILAGLCIFLVIMLQRAVKKPPLVIKVDELGRIETIKDWRQKTYVTEPEIINFAKSFIEYYMGYDFYAYDNNFKKAFMMVTPEFGKRADEQLQVKNVVETIKESQYKTVNHIAKIKVIEDTPGNIVLKASGYREQKSYINPDYYKETIFESDLVLKRVNRTESVPWGLLVDNYVETIIKEK